MGVDQVSEFAGEGEDGEGCYVEGLRGGALVSLPTRPRLRLASRFLNLNVPPGLGCSVSLGQDEVESGFG
ncbi:hypothetical protein KC354_g15 [Hortaea werneckii]|nr:hypothetical protein KC354_g15 [Hortaea werneckii]